MPRNTRTNRRSPGKAAGEYARSMPFDEMPHGGSASSPRAGRTRRPDAGQGGWLPARRLVDVVMGSGIKKRWAIIVPANG